MANVYTKASISNYNDNPPPDDGTQNSDNEVTWSKHKTKLADPLKSFADAINNNVDSAFDKIFLNGITAISSNYTIQTSDRGKLISVTNTTTITLLAAGTAGGGFAIAVRNDGSNTVTVDGNGAETINGSTTIDLDPGDSLFITTDGSNWEGPVLRTNYITTNAPDAADGGTDAFTGNSGRTLASGQVYPWDFGSANTTTTPTLNDNTQGAKTIKRMNGDALAVGDIQATTHHLYYDGTDYLLLNPTLERNTTRAWANFDGTGTVSIRDDLNVSSITDNGTGNYTVNTSITFANTNFVVLGTCRSPSAGGNTTVGIHSNGFTTTSAQISTVFTTNTFFDSPEVCVAFIGGN